MAQRFAVRSRMSSPKCSFPTMPGLQALLRETTGDPEVVIAVLDGPVDLMHPALVGADLTVIGSGAELSSRQSGPAAQHGTFVASLIFGQHGASSPVMGIAPTCRGIVVPIFNDYSTRLPPCNTDAQFIPVCSQIDLARAILLAAMGGARIINVSGGQYSPAGVAHPILADAVAQCARRGILIVAAAGNDGCECLHIPAALPGVLAVGAMNWQGKPLQRSNWGPLYRTGGLLALGDRLVGARAGGGTLTASGTSLATALVSGITGLLWSVSLQHHWSFDGGEIRQILLDSVDRCFDDLPTCHRQLAGRLNLIRASAMLRRRGMNMSMEPPLPSTGAAASSLDVPPVVEVFDNRDDHKASAGITAVETSANVTQSTEGCGCAACRAANSGRQQSGLVFALGTIGYDLVSDARRDSIKQHMPAKADPSDPASLLDYLQQHPWEAASIQWTLSIDQMALYVIMPAGPFAGEAYGRLREFLTDQLKANVERVSIAGQLRGQARVFNGQTLPVVVPELRGMYSWTTEALVKGVAGSAPKHRRQQHSAMHMPQSAKACAAFSSGCIMSFTTLALRLRIGAQLCGHKPVSESSRHL